jgi:hypothetical protein
MTYAITQTCIRCQRCLSACPTGAIVTDGSAFWIDSDRCNQCEGTYGVSQCWAVCPTNAGCVSLDPSLSASLSASLGASLGIGSLQQALTSCSEGSRDYWDAWFDRYARLVAHLPALKQPHYWQQWFDRYAETLLRLQARNRSNIPLMP